MGRILSIDYGLKRVGLAVTDEHKIIATALDTVHSKDVLEYLKKYIAENQVECIVIGDPKQMNNQPSEIVKHINPFVKKLKKTFPGLRIDRYDERFTSKLAMESMVASGMRKKERRNKANVDKISAVLILQSYMHFITGKI